MDGESVNSQSRGAQQFLQTSTGGQGNSSATPSIEEKASAAGAAKVQTGSPGATVEEFIDVSLKDGIVNELPTAQVFTKPIIKTFSESMSHPTLVPSDGSITEGHKGMHKLFDVKSQFYAATDAAKAFGVKPSKIASEFAGGEPSVSLDFSQFPELVNGASARGISPKEFFAVVQEWKNLHFEKHLKHLPENKANMLRAAYYLPESTKDLPPELQELLAKFTGEAESKTGNLLGITNFKGLPVDARNFNQNLNTEVGQAYDKAFVTLVKNGAAKLPTNVEQKDIANTSSKDIINEDGTHTIGGEKVPHHIAQLIKSLTQTVNVDELQAKYNFDSDWRPNPDTAFYNNVVNGDFAQNFTKDIKGYYGKVTDASKKVAIEKLIANPSDPSVLNDPNLSESEKKDLVDLAKNISQARNGMLTHYDAFVKNPHDPSIPHDIKAKLSQIFEANKVATIEKYNLDKDWSPTIANLSAIEKANINTAQGGIDVAKELLANAYTLVSQMPNGADKHSYMNYLKIIADKLDELQNTIYSMQGSNTEISKKNNSLKLATQLANLDAQKAAAEKAEKANKKMAGAGPLQQFTKWMMNVLIIAVSFMAFPIGPVLATMYVVQTEQKGAGNTFIAEMCKDVCDGLGGLFGNSQAGQIVGGMVNFFLLAMISGGNPLMFMQTFFQESQAVQNLVQIAGGGQMAQQLTVTILNMVAQIALMVAISAATMGAGAPAAASFMTADVAAVGAEGAAGAAAVTSVAAGTTSAAVSATTAVGMTTEEIMKVAMAAVQVVVDALTITSSGIQINNNIILAQITMIKAKSEKLSVELEAMVALLKKLVDKLLNALSGMGDWTVNIQKEVGELFTKGSSITTDIAFAG